VPIDTVMLWAHAEPFKIEFNAATRVREQTEAMFCAGNMEALKQTEVFGHVLERRRWFISTTEFARDFRGYKPTDFGFTIVSIKLNDEGMPEKGICVPYDGTMKPYRILKSFGTCSVAFSKYEAHPLQQIRDGQAEDKRRQCREKNTTARIAGVAKQGGEAVSIEDIERMANAKTLSDKQKTVEIDREVAKAEEAAGGAAARESVSSDGDMPSEGDDSSEDMGAALTFDNFVDEAKTDEHVPQASSSRGRGRKGSKGRGKRGAAATEAPKAETPSRSSAVPSKLDSGSPIITSTFWAAPPQLSGQDAASSAVAGSKEKLENNYEIYMRQLNIGRITLNLADLNSIRYQARRTEKAMVKYVDLNEKRLKLKQRLVSRVDLSFKCFMWPRHHVSKLWFVAFQLLAGVVF
jgi:hypothetical protein